MLKLRLALFALTLSLLAVAPVRAQDNFEIQIYGSDTVAPKTFMTELHSNYSIDGSKLYPAPTTPSTAPIPPTTLDAKPSN